MADETKTPGPGQEPAPPATSKPGVEQEGLKQPSNSSPVYASPFNPYMPQKSDSGGVMKMVLAGAAVIAFLIVIIVIASSIRQKEMTERTNVRQQNKTVRTATRVAGRSENVKTRQTEKTKRKRCRGKKGKKYCHDEEMLAARNQHEIDKLKLEKGLDVSDHNSSSAIANLIKGIGFSFGSRAA